MPDINLDPDVNLEDRARDDALHDLGGLENDEVDFDADTERQPANLDALDVNTTVGPSEHVIAGDEPYDALDAEDVGTAWLRRATQSDPAEMEEPNESLEGMHEVSAGDPSMFGADHEDGFGSDQVGEAFAPHAGTRDDDVAAELPVGTQDAAGNVELHAPINPPDAFGAPPTGALSPTDEEIARRHAAHAADERHSKR
ncbi:MAG TPA: hypothetical protein VMI54_10275 [Polyangiaceae bacterium]|nr:hypothetical protein [Polyangiaceae bacterium]